MWLHVEGVPADAGLNHLAAVDVDSAIEIDGHQDDSTVCVDFASITEAHFRVVEYFGLI